MSTARAKTPVSSTRAKTPVGGKKPSQPVSVPTRKYSTPEKPVGIPTRKYSTGERRQLAKSARGPARLSSPKLSSSAPGPKVRGILKKVAADMTSSDSDNDDEQAAPYGSDDHFLSANFRRREMHVRFAAGTKQDSNNYRKSLPSEDGLDAIDWKLVRAVREREKLDEPAEEAGEKAAEDEDEEDDDDEPVVITKFKKVDNLYILLRSSKETLYITLLTYEEQLIEKARELLYRSPGADSADDSNNNDGSDVLRFTEELEGGGEIEPTGVAKNIIDIVDKLEGKFEQCINNIPKTVKKRKERSAELRSFQKWCRQLKQEAGNVVNPPQVLKSMVPDDQLFPDFKVNV